METDYPIILFDGVCNLCNKWVDFILKRDKKKIFRFVALQSETGRFLIKKFDVLTEIDSVILIFRNSVFIESDAAIEISKLLPFPFNCVVGFKIIPKNWRDNLYKWIARNRYRWFGKNDTCRIPTMEEKLFFPEIADLN